MVLPWGNYIPDFALPDLEQGLKSDKKSTLGLSFSTCFTHSK